jgi:hypothetical protein
VASFTTKAPKIGGTPGTPKVKSIGGESVRFQKSVRPPTRFPHVSVSRRDYAKPEMGAEQPLGMAEGEKSGFGSTGLTGET